MFDRNLRAVSDCGKIHPLVPTQEEFGQALELAYLLDGKFDAEQRRRMSGERRQVGQSGRKLSDRSLPQATITDKT